MLGKVVPEALGLCFSHFHCQELQLQESSELITQLSRESFFGPLCKLVMMKREQSYIPMMILNVIMCSSWHIKNIK